MLTDYARNLMIDHSMRGQAVTFPATRYVALFTSMPTAAGGGTELAATGYARIAIASSLANWSGTQGAGTTSASSGASGEVSNNGLLQFASSITAAWNSIVGAGLYDASSGGNLWEFGNLVDAAGNPITRSFSIGDAVEFAAGTLVIDWT